MGVMKEKLEAVMSEWDKEDEVQTDKKIPLSKKIMEYLLKNPNSTSLQVTNHIMRTYPDTPRGNISSMLKQLSDKNYLERDYYFDTSVCRSSYKYRVLTDVKRQELEVLRKAEEAAGRERLEKMRSLAEAARAAKAAKREERLKAQGQEDTGVSAGLSAALPVSIEVTKPRSNTQEILDNLSITQARELYDELKKIFGG